MNGKRKAVVCGIFAFMIFFISSCRKVNGKEMPASKLSKEYLINESNRGKDFEFIDWQGIRENRIFYPFDELYPVVSNDLQEMYVYNQNTATGKEYPLYLQKYKNGKLVYRKVFPGDVTEYDEYEYDENNRLTRKIVTYDAGDNNMQKHVFMYRYEYDRKEHEFVRIEMNENNQNTETWIEKRMTKNKYQLTVKMKSLNPQFKDPDDSIYIIDFKNGIITDIISFSVDLYDNYYFQYQKNKITCVSITNKMLSKRDKDFVTISEVDFTNYANDLVTEIAGYDFDRKTPQTRTYTGKTKLDKFDKNGNWQYNEAYDESGKKLDIVTIREIKYAQD